MSGRDRGPSPAARGLAALAVAAGLAAALLVDGALGGATGAGRLLDPFLIVAVAAALRLRPHGALAAAAAAGLAQDALGAVVLGVSVLANVVAAWVVIVVASRLAPGAAGAAGAHGAHGATGVGARGFGPFGAVGTAAALALASLVAFGTRFAAGFVLGQELALPGPLALLLGAVGTSVVGTVVLTLPALLASRRGSRFSRPGGRGGHALGRA